MTLTIHSPATSRPAGRATALLGAMMLAMLLVLTACGGSSASSRSPQERLDAAAKTLSTTPGVNVAIATDELPTGVAGLLSAKGTANDQPAFTGIIKVVQSGLSASVDVRALDGDVYINLGSWQKVDPAAYNAPDPSVILTKEGLPSLLAEATSLKAGKEKRSGKAVVTTIGASVPGSAVARLIPSASPDKAFAATFTLDDTDVLVAATLTGEFYPDSPDLAYDFTLADYDTKTTIEKP